MFKIYLSTEEETKIIIKHWIRISNIKLGWIQDFDRFILKYVKFIYYYFIQRKIFSANFFMFEIFCSSPKLPKTLTGHKSWVKSIDYSTFGDNQLICSGSCDTTIRVWDAETNEQIQLFNERSHYVNCVKFSQYHHYNNHSNVICSASSNYIIRFWDLKDNQQLQIISAHTNSVHCIEFSQFHCGRYLCSGSYDRTIRLWDVETYKLLHVFNGYENGVSCIDISPLQSNNNNNDKSNSIGVIGGNGYTICSGSDDKTILVWDIETLKKFIVFKGHKRRITSVKYGSNELGVNGGANTILSGSEDKSVRLWDLRSNQQSQVFKGHTNWVNTVEYSPLVLSNKVSGNSNVICSGSGDNTIRFWDIRSNKEELHMIK
ncbi:serine/threonine protein kinase [Reticulomyxa filosa]|uniref:Serine/threonine protein kinase n=1 Tax=Reticulomyxa filosa TaxID=46433 RepID=X6M4F0_RETFI|nr:serine/threonine protein kinase [Reticulomyxa filosa]|eukprot:ETO08506.1 serine/threonine protein kinase [Reticulomyxa filosa]